MLTQLLFYTSTRKRSEDLVYIVVRFDLLFIHQSVFSFDCLSILLESTIMTIM